MQDHDTDEPQDNALTSSYGDNHDGIPSSYDDDPPQESRSRSLTPTPSTPRARSFDEDTEMPLSSPVRAESPYSSSQEAPPPPQGGNNPTSMALLAEGHDFDAEDGGGGPLSLRDDDAPLARLSQDSTRTDYSHERESSPSEEESTSSQSSQSSSHNDDEEDMTPRSSPQPSSSSYNSGYDADTEMNSPNTSEPGSRSPTSREPSDWDDDDDDDDDEAEKDEEEDRMSERGLRRS